MTDTIKERLSDLEYLGFFLGMSLGMIISSCIWFVVLLGVLVR